MNESFTVGSLVPWDPMVLKDIIGLNDDTFNPICRDRSSIYQYRVEDGHMAVFAYHNGGEAVELARFPWDPPAPSIHCRGGVVSGCLSDWDRRVYAHDWAEEHMAEIVKAANAALAEGRIDEYYRPNKMWAVWDDKKKRCVWQDYVPA